MSSARRVLRVLALPALVAVAAAWWVRRERQAAFLDAVAAEHVDPLDPLEPGEVALRLEPVITGVAQPTDVIPVPGHPDRVAVLSKLGTAYVAIPGGRAEPWFEVPVRTGSELGLLGLAFAPDFARSGVFYVYLAPARGPMRTEVRRATTDPATLAGATFGETLLSVPQPYANHDGGQLAFGPDGKLYVALGDGGSAGDPEGNAQDLGTLLGSILRLDPSLPPPHVPPDNPFVGRPGARPEIWAYGLRNPWRFTFDPAGRLVAADVGQARVEEVDLVSAGDNLGWDVREGDLCFEPPEGCAAGFVDPIWTYGHDQGISITGGVVAGAGPLAGRYVFADFGTGRFWAMTLPDTVSRVSGVTPLGRFDVHPSAFARAPDGQVWVADFARGAVLALRPAGG